MFIGTGGIDSTFQLAKRDIAGILTENTAIIAHIIFWCNIEKREINNALLLAYQTYEHSLVDFDKLFEHFGGDFKKTLEWLKGLANEKKPDQVLRDFVSKA